MQKPNCSNIANKYKHGHGLMVKLSILEMTVLGLYQFSSKRSFRKIFQELSKQFEKFFSKCIFLCFLLVFYLIIKGFFCSLV